MAGQSTLTHVWATTVKNDTGSAVLADTQTLTGSNEFNQKISVVAGQVAEMDCGSLPFAKIVSMFLNCDQAVDIYTNASDGTGGQHIALAAKKAYSWNNLLPTACPITANITKIYVNNSNGVNTANFVAGFLMNLLV